MAYGSTPLRRDAESLNDRYGWGTWIPKNKEIPQLYQWLAVEASPLCSTDVGQSSVAALVAHIGFERNVLQCSVSQTQGHRSRWVQPSRHQFDHAIIRRANGGHVALGLSSVMSTTPKRPTKVKVKTSPTKADLELRVDKLERANIQLRYKIKEFQRLYVQAAEELDALKADLSGK